MPPFKILLSMCCLLFLLVPVTSAQDTDLKLYEWENIHFQYPDRWEVVIDEGDESLRQIKLVPNGREDLSILLSLFAEFPEPDEEYWKMPVKASVSFGLGLALKLAGDAGENAIALHHGSIELDEGPVMSARFSIFPPDSGAFHMLECFHAYDEESAGAYMGMIMTRGLKGQIIDELDYLQYIEEAYGIVRSIVIE